MQETITWQNLSFICFDKIFEIANGSQEDFSSNSQFTVNKDSNVETNEELWIWDVNLENIKSPKDTLKNRLWKVWWGLTKNLNLYFEYFSKWGNRKSAWCAFR